MYVNDLDVLVMIVLLEDSLEVQCEEMDSSDEWRKGEALLMIKRWKIILCKFENHVPLVAVSEAPRNASAKASGDRLHFPGVLTPGDQSHKVPEWLEPFEGLSGEPPTCS